ncbi:MAG TPA: ferredoxin [Candidatus Aenigmarchaeota archaeon]|nr:ferredoxin [Candidatus Aenigmarchaeota archaeon]
MKISVDEEKCIGCGACASICPEVFELGENGKARAKVEESDVECVKEAKETCPAGAITLS